jgi:glycosyltransferase involved in cell wall biosynthesis
MTSRKPRVCFFNRSYWPDTGATGQLLTELAEDLTAQHGFEVTVVTGQPRGAAPRPRARETRHGVHIVRAPGTTFNPRRFWARAANYLTYFTSACLAAWRLPRQDVVIAMTDPPIIGLAALTARRGARFAFFCQDVFPEVAALLEDFQSPWANRTLDRINRLLIRQSDRVIVIGERMARRLIEEKGARPDCVTIIHNWADTAAIVPDASANPFSQAQALEGRFVVLHAGNLGQGQHLGGVMDAAASLSDLRDVVFLFIGDGTRRVALQTEAAERQLANVRFVGFQPREHLRWTYASADLCLISLRPGLSGYIVPSKLYPILAAGRPFVAAIDADSEAADIARRFECGVVVAPGDAAALAQAIRRLAADPDTCLRMGRNARHAALEFSRQRQVASHAAVLKRMSAAT